MHRIVLGYCCALVWMLAGCGSGGAVPSVALLSPNGGEVWAAGGTETVTWQSTGHVGDVHLAYSVDGGGTWIPLVERTPDDGSETVAVPMLASSTVRLRILLLGWLEQFPPPLDVSASDFTIVPPIVLTSPVGGEVWPVGSMQTVTWDPGTYTGLMDIDFSSDGGATWTSLVAATANDGSEVVSVPAAVTHQARIRVGAADGDPSLASLPSDASAGDIRVDGGMVDIGAGLPGVWRGALAWGDYDRDGDPDLALSGLATTGRVCRIYRNDGGSLVDIAAGLPGVEDGKLAWGDYDNDGDLDLLMCGGADPGGGFHRPGTVSRITRIYRNDAGVFSDIGAGLVGVKDGDLAWGDYDNDGDLDLVLTGFGSTLTTRIYRNDAGAFIDIGAALPDVFASTVAWIDYDADGDLDLTLAGSVGASRISRIYRNDGGTFTDITAGLEGIGPGAVAWGDYDGDGDPDLAMVGFMTSGPDSVPMSRIYRNDAGSFVDIGAAMVPLGYSDLAWGDYDNDGDLDLVIAGHDAAMNPLAILYRNDAGTFIDSGAALPGAWTSAVRWGDLDEDGDLDLAISGLSDGGTFVSRVYRNDRGFAPNTPPVAPTGLVATPGVGEVALQWIPASDGTTPEAVLSYNLRIGSTPTTSESFPAMAEDDGRRLIPVPGPIVRQPGGLISHAVTLPPGTYHATVQAIDASHAGGAWSDPVMFTVP